MVEYHDSEWGVPVHDDVKLFEFLVLEGAQAGLSWETVLRKRDGYRKVFAGFDPNKVSTFSGEDIERLLADPGIIRNRQKVSAAITNAQHLLDVQSELGSFASYLWEFVDDKPIRNHFQTIAEIPAETAESRSMSKDLKRRGFRFVGPTICYALMQAVGMVNDHEVGCFRYREL